MTTKPIVKRCSERVSDDTGFHHHQCSRTGIIERNGKLYCKQHDPEAVAQKREEGHVKYIDAMNRRSRDYHRLATWEQLYHALEEAHRALHGQPTSGPEQALLVVEAALEATKEE